MLDIVCPLPYTLSILINPAVGSKRPKLGTTYTMFPSHLTSYWVLPMDAADGDYEVEGVIDKSTHFFSWPPTFQAAAHPFNYQSVHFLWGDYLLQLQLSLC